MPLPKFYSGGCIQHLEGTWNSLNWWLWILHAMLKQVKTLSYSSQWYT